MQILFFVLFIIFSYLLGSFPTSYFIGKKFYDVDIRKFGSKNPGTTNAFRVLGKKAGVFVFFTDIFKGWLPVFISIHYYNILPNSYDKYLFAIIIGIICVVGHTFSVFLNFKGGKGVATSLGVIIAIQPLVALICFIIFILILIITKYVSAGSIISAIFFPLIILIFYPSSSISLIVFSVILPMFIIITHKKNIIRIINFSENKTYIFKKSE